MTAIGEIRIELCERITQLKRPGGNRGNIGKLIMRKIDLEKLDWFGKISARGYGCRHDL
jgi:hypothetical protein